MQSACAQERDEPRAAQKNLIGAVLESVKYFSFPNWYITSGVGILSLLFPITFELGLLFVRGIYLRFSFYGPVWRSSSGQAVMLPRECSRIARYLMVKGYPRDKEHTFIYRRASFKIERTSSIAKNILQKYLKYPAL